MKRVILLDHINKLHFISGMLVILCIPLYKYVLTWLMGAFIFFGILRFFFLKRDQYSIKHINKLFLLSVIAYFSLLLFGLLYAKNMQEGLVDIKLNVQLFIFPIVFFQPNKYINKNTNLYLLLFVMGSFLSILTGLVIFLFKYNGENTIKILTESLSFFHHHSYLAMYVVFSVIILVYFLEKNIFCKSQAQKLLLIAVIGVFIGAIYFLFSKAGILSLLVLGGITIFRIFSKKILHLIIVLLLCIPLVFVLLKHSQIKDLRSRLDYYKKSQTDKRYRKVIPVRIVIWENAIKLIKEKPVFGHGTSSSTTVLLEQYKKAKEEFVLKQKFNAHNQFFEILINHGIVGLLIFLSMFAVFFIKGIKTRNVLLINFSVLVVFFLLFETMLSTLSGVSFIAFFLGFLFFIDFQTVNKNRNQKNLFYSE